MRAYIKKERKKENKLTPRQGNSEKSRNSDFRQEIDGSIESMEIEYTLSLSDSGLA